MYNDVEIAEEDYSNNLSTEIKFMNSLTYLLSYEECISSKFIYSVVIYGDRHKTQTAIFNK
jgi:hypothetical protein